MKKFMNQEDMKYENCMDVFFLIKELKQTTRKQIESVTGLSWGAVSNITSRLLKAGYIEEGKPEGVAGPGRTPSWLEVDGSRYCTIGVDVNLTGLEAELMNLKNQALKRWRCKSNYSSKEALLSDIVSMLTAVLGDEESKKHKIMGIGIAMQGIVDAKNGVSVSLTQCKDWREVPLASVLEKKFSIPVWLEHDPNCILFAHGGNSTVENAILLRLDRGIGMSVMLDGRIVSGVGMFEIGHTTVVPGGNICSCGNKGCLEAYASVNALERQFGGTFDRLSAAAEAGEAHALQCFEEMAEWLGIAIHNMRKIFHVTDIILCGEMMDCRKFFLETVKSRNQDAEITVIDESCASYGAAMIALEQSMRNIRI